ncbi:MAG: 1-acyl-sn-glycerol-3-phosphate acyltransferase [Firmicutes bacterium]|nr:1-acyl-sn-glycerol-3-phosphate acyltransferase [Bacillota bacterium]
MKIKTRELSYEEVLKLKKPASKRPEKPAAFFKWLVHTLGASDLKATNFKADVHDMKDAADKPALIFMNHSSFIDLKIVSELMYPRPYNIVCTSDGFVGKEWLMRKIGCIDTCKFVTDVSLVGKLRYCLDTLGSSVLMFPEASYTFDGTATPLPRRLGVLLKRLGAPVIMIKTEGAFTRDPLYNNLQLRKVNVCAEMYCLFSSKEIEELPEEELDRRLDEVFSFDNWRWQAENQIRVTESFRADGLDRILFRCAECGAEGFMEGKGTRLVCSHCGAEYELDEFGRLQKIKDGKAGGQGPQKSFEFVSDWYAWERSEIRKEIEAGAYLLDTEVRIGCMVDFKAIYMTGDGRLIHNNDGFKLLDAAGNVLYTQKPGANYGLYADYYWYEIGDMICIGDSDLLYYCFPKGKSMVAKARIAAEEMYKLRAAEKAARRAKKAAKNE